eukprot:scaffold2637_cov270-Ochromonas_danica.AAC.1
MRSTDSLLLRPRENSESLRGSAKPAEATAAACSASEEKVTRELFLLPDRAFSEKNNPALQRPRKVATIVLRKKAEARYGGWSWSALPVV